MPNVLFFDIFYFDKLQISSKRCTLLPLQRIKTIWIIIYNNCHVYPLFQSKTINNEVYFSMSLSKQFCQNKIPELFKDFSRIIFIFHGMWLIYLCRSPWYMYDRNLLSMLLELFNKLSVLV